MKSNNPDYQTMAWFIKQDIKGKVFLESIEIAKNHPGICSVIQCDGIVSCQYLDSSVLHLYLA